MPWIVEDANGDLVVDLAQAPWLTEDANGDLVVDLATSGTNVVEDANGDLIVDLGPAVIASLPLVQAMPMTHLTRR